MKEFKINKYITLKQEHDITKILVERDHFVMWYSSISISRCNEKNIDEEFNNRYLSIQNNRLDFHLHYFLSWRMPPTSVSFAI